jgi:hypothetical protein
LSDDEKNVLQQAQGDVYKRGGWTLTDVLKTLQVRNQKAKDNAQKERENNGKKSDGGRDGDRSASEIERILKKIVRSVKNYDDEN